MEFLGDLVSLGGAAITGGLTGVIGFALKALFAWLGIREERAKLKMQQEHELALLREQRETRKVETENERAIAAEETRQASYQYANLSRGQEVYKWVASFVMMMRPIITIYLLVMTTTLVYVLFFGKPLPYIDTRGIIKELVITVVFLTSTSVTWWFGDRPPQKR